MRHSISGERRGVRIIGGTWRGRTVRTLSGDKLRPTSDKVRESLFAILGGRVAGRDFLDLFAGSGSVGIEALSRGANRAVFVENHGHALRMIVRNLEAVGGRERGFALRGDLPGAVGRIARFELDVGCVYIDPPYDAGLLAPTLEAVCRLSAVGSETVIVCEHRTKNPLEPPSDAIVQTDRRRYGSTSLSFYRVLETGSQPESIR